MSNYRPDNERRELHRRVLNAAAKLFLEQGYSLTSLREIATEADVNINTMNRAYGSKENILYELVTFILEEQFETAKKLVAGKTEDPVLLYAAETALQIYMAEYSEPVRDLYGSAYTMPNTSALILDTVAGKLEGVFQPYQPDAKAKDFRELEIASGGIMRGYMLAKSDVYFTTACKVRRFLEAALRVYQVPEEKIAEAVAFTGQFDYPRIAGETIASLFDLLEKLDESSFD